jgi:hypothetical protein
MNTEKNATVERKRRRKAFKGADCYTTDTAFRGAAVGGEVWLIDTPGDPDDLDDVRVTVHVDAQAVVDVTFVESLVSRHRADGGFVTVKASAWYPSGTVLKPPEATTFMSVEQARSLRDSLNALDI